MGPRRGILIIISSPSGAGKTTLARQLLAEFPELRFSVSYTTRAPRVNELHGVDYYFVSPPEFEDMIERGEFAEWAQVHGNRYGTSRKVVEEALASGRHVVFDVDWQGGAALAWQWPLDALRVFILPPDLASLEERLRRRATDSEEVIQRRLRMAIDELGHHGEYEHRIVNQELEEAYRKLRAIYLVRRDGPEAAGPELAQLEADSRSRGGAEHADRLVAAGRAAAEGRRS
ncbi:MAG TPA: guanylate kinase [Kofleriaceae bacterium]|nr:guanylate kinase [Kofleriaceae bacterium]